MGLSSEMGGFCGRSYRKVGRNYRIQEEREAKLKKKFEKEKKAKRESDKKANGKFELSARTWNGGKKESADGTAKV